MAEAEPDVEGVDSSEEEDYSSEEDYSGVDDYYSAEEEEEDGPGVTVEIDGLVSRSVANRFFNYVPFNGDRLGLPFCLGSALLIRGHRGAITLLDTSREQAYKPVPGRRLADGEDYVCETCNLLWSLGDRDEGLISERRRARRHPCCGSPGPRGHTGDHRFTKYDVLRLYLGHRLRLRILLAGSTVSDLLFICLYVCISLHLFSSIYECLPLARVREKKGKNRVLPSGHPISMYIYIYIYISHFSHTQALAALFFERLFREHFPYFTQEIVNFCRERVLRLMAVSLGRAAVDGILFSGEDAVTRANSQELQRLFGDANVEDLDLYAHCYEWTHWSPVLTALGACFSFSYTHIYICTHIYIFVFYVQRTGLRRPEQAQMLDYWQRNNLIRPHTRMPRGRIYCDFNRPWLNRVVQPAPVPVPATPTHGVFEPESEDEELAEELRGHRRFNLDLAQRLFDSLEAEEHHYVRQAALQSPPLPPNGIWRPDTDDEILAERVEREIAELRHLDTASERFAADLAASALVVHSTPVKQRGASTTSTATAAPRRPSPYSISMYISLRLLLLIVHHYIHMY